jgi:RNA polymerase sigma-70 factor (ECF subfamily)
VLSKVYGKQKAIEEAEKLGLENNQYYYSLLGELYTDIDNMKAKQNFEKAFSLAKTQADRQTIEKKIRSILPK